MICLVCWREYEPPEHDCDDDRCRKILAVRKKFYSELSAHSLPDSPTQADLDAYEEWADNWDRRFEEALEVARKES